MSRPWALSTLLLTLALTASACTNENSPSPSPSGDASASGEPVRGGTLKVLGGSDVDHLDPASAYSVTANTLLRATTRQLVSYESTPDEDRRDRVVADLATEVPQPTGNGLVYTFTIRDGASWDVPGGPRQITAADAALGLERLCNPVQPAGALGYFVGVIEGMEEFCAGFEGVDPTVEAIREYVTQNDVSGVRAEGQELEVTLTQPSGDFLNIMALPFGSPVPVEVLDHLPDSPEFRQSFVSSGPYRIESYEPDSSIVLVRNPAWDRASDPLRAANVDRIEVTLGSDGGPVQQQLEAGTVDLPWDTRVPTASIPALLAREDDNLVFFENGSTTYMVMNLDSPNASGALGKVEVRRALNYAVDKANVIQVLGGPDLYEPIGQVLTPPLLGFEEHDPYATEGSGGDPERARELLAEAGYPDGLELVYVYPNVGKSPQVATTLQEDLAEAGVTLELRPLPPPEVGRILTTPDARTAGEWDLAVPSWNPDWQGNAARSFFVPLLDGRQCGEGSSNYGCYDEPEVNELIDRALSQPADEAADTWAEADRRVMEDAPWVPITTGRDPWYHAERVEGFVPFPLAGGNADFTNVWLTDAR